MRPVASRLVEVHRVLEVLELLGCSALANGRALSGSAAVAAVEEAEIWDEAVAEDDEEADTWDGALRMCNSSSRCCRCVPPWRGQLCVRPCVYLCPYLCPYLSLLRHSFVGKNAE